MHCSFGRPASNNDSSRMPQTQQGGEACQYRGPPTTITIPDFGDSWQLPKTRGFPERGCTKEKNPMSPTARPKALNPKPQPPSPKPLSPKPPNPTNPEKKPRLSETRLLRRARNDPATTGWAVGGFWTALQCTGALGSEFWV